jgi:broad specificity phosphatase PhoE
VRITLVRHGETTGQSSIRYHGATDVPLSELGRAQMHRVRNALAGERFAAVFSSRLSRSKEAAAIIAGDAGRVHSIAAFDEVDFGRWEGWTREEIALRDPEAYRAWQMDGDRFAYPGGESRQGFAVRVNCALDQILETDRRNLLIVVHRGVIAVILARLLRLQREERLRLGIDLGSIHIVEESGSAWRPLCLNRTDHLNGVLRNEC